MKASLIAIVAVAGLTATVASQPAVAALTAGDIIYLADREGSTGGGEFGVFLKTDAPPADNLPLNVELFRTFCVQTTESIDFSMGGFKIDSITDHTIAGNDPISQQTAYLFSRFSQGILGHYDYTPSAGEHVSDANDLQKAIWWLENEISTSFGSLPSETQQWINEANSNSTAADLLSVFVLNLSYATNRNGHYVGQKAQDQLYYNPPPPPPPDGAPEPATLLVWTVLGLSAGCVYRSRVRRGAQ